jgi:hypothetical protein
MSGSERFALLQVELGEVLHQATEHHVAVLGVAELALVVEVDAGHHPFELGVGLFEGSGGLVERLADVGGDLLNLGPAGALGHEEVVLVGSSGSAPFTPLRASTSSSKRSESRFKNRKPKMKPL